MKCSEKLWVTGSLSQVSWIALDLCTANISSVLQLCHSNASLCLCLLGDVYIQPTQDIKNPVIYGVFSVSGWVGIYQKRSSSIWKLVNTERACLAWAVVHCICIWIFPCTHLNTFYINSYIQYMSFINKTVIPPALYLKAQRSASTPWQTFGWCSMDLLPTKKVPIISGWPTLEKSPTLVQEQWVSPSYEPDYQ